MGANTSPIFGKTPKTQGTTFVNSDSTTPKTIYTAGSNGARVLAISATTDDTSANDVNLYVQSGGAGTAFNIGGKQVAAGAGKVAASTTASRNLLDSSQLAGSLLSDGSLQLGAGDVLQAGVVAAVTSTKTLTLVVYSIDY